MTPEARFLLDLHFKATLAEWRGCHFGGAVRKMILAQLTALALATSAGAQHMHGQVLAEIGHSPNRNRPLHG